MESGSSLGLPKSSRLQEMGFISSQALWLSKAQEGPGLHWSLLVLDADSPQQRATGTYLHFPVV